MSRLRYCKSCRKSVFIVRREPIWVLHQVFLLLSCGLSLPISLLVLWLNKSWSCPKCNRVIRS